MSTIPCDTLSLQQHLQHRHKLILRTNEGTAPLPKWNECNKKKQKEAIIDKLEKAINARQRKERNISEWWDLEVAAGEALVFSALIYTLQMITLGYN